jgi:hypothetical protein
MRACAFLNTHIREREGGEGERREGVREGKERVVGEYVRVRTHIYK